MNTLAYISVFILVLVWIGLVIAGLSDDLFKGDEQDKQHPGYLSKNQPHNPSVNVRPEFPEKK